MQVIKTGAAKGTQQQSVLGGAARKTGGEGTYRSQKCGRVGMQGRRYHPASIELESAKFGPEAIELLREAQPKAPSSSRQAGHLVRILTRDPGTQHQSGFFERPRQRHPAPIETKASGPDQAGPLVWIHSHRRAKAPSTRYRTKGGTPSNADRFDRGSKARPAGVQRHQQHTPTKSRSPSAAFSSLHKQGTQQQSAGGDAREGGRQIF